jgi:hypothetical protein
MCVAFMLMHLVVFECKRFQKCVQELSKSFREFSGFFWNFFSFSLSYFYLLEGSKIFFMSSKCFIWIVQVLIQLWDFPEIFGIFRVFFVALSIYLDNSGFIFAQEKYF